MLHDRLTKKTKFRISNKEVYEIIETNFQIYFHSIYNPTVNNNCFPYKSKLKDWKISIC